MAFNKPTLQEIIDRIVSDFNTRVDNATTFLRRSVFRIFGRVFGGAVHLVYGYIDFLKRQLFTTTADSEGLETLGSEYGIVRKVGTKAQGTGTATGTTGLTINAGTQLQSDSGFIYTVDSDVTLVAGTGSVSITAEEYGDDSNDEGGISLSFVTPIAGINSTITISVNGITGGVDEESDDDLRDRILTRKRQPPHGGAEFDYEVWAKEVSGVTRAWSIPLYQGVGTIGLAFVRDDDADSIIPNETQMATVEAYVISHTDPLTGLTVGIPVTAEPGFFMITLSPLAVNLNIKIYPNTTTVQDSIEERLQDLITNNGGPEQTVSLSQMYEAISSATSEVRSLIVSPVADVTAAVDEVHVLGSITYQDYE